MVLVATDLDGTLVPSNSTVVSPYTADVLRRVDAAGIPVVFVTARPLRSLEPLWPHVGRHGLAILSNGAVTFDVRRREIVSTAGIGPEPGAAIAAAIAAAVPGSTFAIECLDGIRMDPRYAGPYPVPPGSARGPLSEIWDVPAVKLLARHPELGHDESVSLVVAAIGDTAIATWSDHGLVEISAAGVTKASALIDLCSGAGIEASDVVAFGDMPNDIPMLTWAGTSYAVGNAHPSVLAAADRVCPPWDQEGVASTLESLLACGTA